MLSITSATITPLPTVAALPSNGVVTLKAGDFGDTDQATNFSLSINLEAPMTASSLS